MFYDFEKLEKSIWILFDPNFYVDFNCYLQPYRHKIQLLVEFIGVLDEFLRWLKPRLHRFFSNFKKNFFYTCAPRMAIRRRLVYNSLIKSNKCTNFYFKLDLLVNLLDDIHSYIMIKPIYRYGSITNRRKIFFFEIKRKIFQLFQIHYL